MRYNPQTGRVVAGEGVVAANPYTGRAAAAGQREVVNTNPAATTRSAGIAGRGPEGAGAAGAFSSQGASGDIAGAGHIRYDRDTGEIDRGGVVKAGDDVYAGHDGHVWKKTDDGWQSMVGGQGSTRQGPPDPRSTATASPATAAPTGSAAEAPTGSTAARCAAGSAAGWAAHARRWGAGSAAAASTGAR